MVIEKKLFALKDVAELANTSSSNVSNWRARDPRFPLPLEDTSAGPIWKGEDIVKYLEQKTSGAYDVIAAGSLSTKRIALLGRARVGKSFLISRFVANSAAFCKVFSGGGGDKTLCPVYVKISENFAQESFVLRTNFNTIYRSDKSDENDENLSNLKERITELSGHFYSMDDNTSMAKIEQVVRELREIEKNFHNRKQSNTYIECFQTPSDFLKMLMRECNLGTLEFVDTPGVSGSVEASKIAKSDIYVFILRPDNQEEAQTLRKIVDQIKPDVAVSNVLFLYRAETWIESQEEFDEEMENARKDMSVFNAIFEDLRGSIISTSIDLLDPAGHCLLFPTMKAAKATVSENLFLQALGEKLKSAFSGDEEEKSTEEFQRVFQEHGDAVKELAFSILSEIPNHKYGNEGVFTTADFSNEKHDRVMTKDDYRIHNDLYRAYSEEAFLLGHYFSAFQAEDYPEDWQRIVIKYLYRVLSNSIRTDRGLGVGAHPWEEHPARTMLVEESILADAVLEAISGVAEERQNGPYRNALKRGGIKSATWNYVGCTSDKEAMLKLEIVRKCLLGFNVSNRMEMILCRYVGGLRKLAEFQILTKLGCTRDESMGMLQRLPF